MSARYGDKTRSGDAVSQSGRRVPLGGGSLTFYEEEFTAPGTWTWPGNCSTVEVLVVGGGGGGSYAGTPPSAVFDAGGGGGVGVFTVPVSAPVPVTVGAGGAAGVAVTPTAVTRAGSPGGTSGFGPTAPPVPYTAAVVGGGVGGAANSPPNWFGGSTYENNADMASADLSYGSHGYSTSPNLARYAGGAGGFNSTTGGVAGSRDRYGYGAGGVSMPAAGSIYQRGFVLTDPSQPVPRVTTLPNTGHGGSGAYKAPGSPIRVQGTDGSSGIVIVRWAE